MFQEPPISAQTRLEKNVTLALKTKRRLDGMQVKACRSPRAHARRTPGGPAPAGGPGCVPVRRCPAQGAMREAPESGEGTPTRLPHPQVLTGKTPGKNPETAAPPVRGGGRGTGSSRCRHLPSAPICVPPCLP